MPSKPNVSTPPWLFSTLTQIQVCGLVQSTCFTVPVIVFSVVIVNAEKE